MNKTLPRKARILFLFSDTGGGHRSATEAIIEALECDFPGQFNLAKVDFFKQYAPPPLDRMPALYPEMVKVPRAWGWGFRLSNGHRRGRLLSGATWLYVSEAAR
jgi:1,2-diacylglycerol 3-beta-galactosyltransferase